MWQELCELIAKNPEGITCLNADAVIRSGFRKFTDQVGEQWCLLADFYIRQGLFEKARDVYEEGIQSVQKGVEKNKRYPRFVEVNGQF